jgi:multidrug efflux pump subunit AcrB
MINYYIKKPHVVFATLIVALFLGIVGYFELPRDLFPPSNRPQVAVVTIEPGASSKYVADHVSSVIERELYTIDGVRRVFSASQDGLSVVTAEFHYGKSIGQAETDVANSITKIRSLLPSDIQEPAIYPITSYTPPVVVLGVWPKKGTNLSLADVRYIADNYLKPSLLRTGVVSNVDVFGGYQKEIDVEIDPIKLASYHLSVSDVIDAVKFANKDVPMGIILNKNSQYVFKLKTEAKSLNQIKNIYITPNIALKDIATVKYAIQDPRSMYRANNHQAIALAIQRPYGGAALTTIDAVYKLLPKLRNEFPELNIQVADSQKRLIELSNDNMFEALRDAIIFTSLVIFIFLADLRMTLISAMSIPFVYAGTIGIMWILGIEFNLVTLTAIILALGMLVDDAIVILENIERHYVELNKSPIQAAIDGTKEVMLVVFAGTLATSIVLLPLLFVGSYPERIFRPLAGTLIIAVLVSYIVSITFIPIVSIRFLKSEGKKLPFETFINNVVEKILNPLKSFYISWNALMINNKIAMRVFMILGVLLFVISLRDILPLEGRDLMPPMDTGIAIAKVTFYPNTSIYKVDEETAKIEKYIYSLKSDGRYVTKTTSIAIGTEPGVFTVGGGTPYQASMTIHFINRFKRTKTLWQLEDEIRNFIHTLPDVEYADVYDYGATAVSSITANLDVTLFSPSLSALNESGNELMKVFAHTKGLKSYSRSWDMNALEYDFKIDKQKCAFYHTTPFAVASQVAQGLSGVVSSVFTIPNQTGYLIRVISYPQDRDKLFKFKTYPIKTPDGFIPLEAFGHFVVSHQPTVITRQAMEYTLDLYGYRSTYPITHIMDSFDREFKKLHIKLPPDVKMEQTGDISMMSDSMGRMAKAIGIGIVLLYLVLVPVFGSWRSPLAIILAIPLGAIGGAWALLIMDKHGSLPAIMGFVLLGSIIVKNSILLIDFIQERQKEGMDLKQAISESIRLRTRPVLMTAFGTAVGMIPIALEWAIGLERLAPLAAVAIGGLLLGTFLSLVYVPTFYYLLSKKGQNNET